MKLARFLFVLHVSALAFGLGGLLIALPHPELWASSPTAGSVYTFGMNHGGAVQIIFGAAAMLAFGVYALGVRKTLIFFVVGTIVPLCAELLGTGTGWPFGGYSYTDGLGFKILGRVPYSVPLSWFYMGFASYLVAITISRSWRPKHQTWGAIVLGAWLLMAWDLALDPAMADASMPIRFWNWHETGPYFGMPLRNLAGWFGTALLFIGVSRAVWRAKPDPKRISAWLPFAVYTVNVLWAVALSLSASLWLAAAAALMLGLVPTSLALWAARPEAARQAPIRSRALGERVVGH